MSPGNNHFEQMIVGENGFQTSNDLSLWRRSTLWCKKYGIVGTCVFTILLLLTLAEQHTVNSNFDIDLDNKTSTTIPGNHSEEANVTIPGDLQTYDSVAYDLSLENEDNVNMMVDLFHDSEEVINPCDNFYNFACQKWYLKHLRQSSVTKWNVWDRFEEKMHRIINEIIEEPVQNEEITAFKKARDYYRKCLDFFSAHDKGKSNTFCISQVLEVFPFAIGQIYLKRLYNSTEELYKNLAQAETMAENIREQVLEYLNITSKGGFDSKEIKDMKICLGFPTWIFNATKVDEVYSDLNLVENTFYEQKASARKWMSEKAYQSNIVDSKGCDFRDFLGGRFGFFHSNFQVDMTMGWIQGCNDMDNRLSMKYGCTGFVLGHEIVHAVHYSDWKTHNNESFSDVKTCLKDQYDGFTVVGLREQGYFLDGIHTLKENYADNGGLQAAYYAYKTAVKMTPSEKIKSENNNELDEYTDDQLFFLAFAQSWCKSHTLEEIQEGMQDKTHSPAMFRIIGTLQNFQEFSKAWNCPVGSKMNPHKSAQQKCLVFA